MNDWEDSQSSHYFRRACDILQYFYRRMVAIPGETRKCKGVDPQETKSIPEYVVNMYGF